LGGYWVRQRGECAGKKRVEKKKTGKKGEETRKGKRNGRKNVSQDMKGV